MEPCGVVVGALDGFEGTDLGRGIHHYVISPAHHYADIPHHIPHESLALGCNHNTVFSALGEHMLHGGRNGCALHDGVAENLVGYVLTCQGAAKSH